jgi:geranylgeranyl diphosphate synthase type I
MTSTRTSPVKAVEDALRRFFADRRDEAAAIGPACVDAVTELETYVLRGGKRVRPTFAWLGWLGAGGDESADGATAELVARVGAALELFHAAALIHDDIIDRSDTRRGAPSAHRLFERLHENSGWLRRADEFGSASAILLGDLILGWSDELLDEGLDAMPDRDAARAARAEFVRMRTEVTAGQYLDLLRAAGGLPGPQGALTVARYKSAGYTVQRPLQLGAAIAGAGPEVADACTAIGLPLGEAFQLRDDVLGVFGDPAVTGKSADDDLREGKQTLLIALAEEAADESGRRLLDRLLGNADAGPEEFDALRRLLEFTGARARVEERITERTALARSAIAAAPLADDARAALDALAVAATSRTA